MKTGSEVKLTVATATLNAVSSGRAAGLERCIRSVAALPFPHEHLVRDGGSRDGTCETLDRLSHQVPELKVSSSPDRGIYDALNGALAEARGEWLLVLGDDDAIVDASALADMLGTASVRSCDIMVTSIALDGDRRITARPWFVLGGMSCPHQGMLVRTSVLRGIGGFDVRYRIAGDYDVFLRLMLGNARLSRFDRPFAYFSSGTGVSRDTGACEAEVAAVLSSRLGLSAADRDFRLRNCVLPICRSIRFLCHRSPHVRASARRQVVKRMAQIFGLCGVSK